MQLYDDAIYVACRALALAGGIVFLWSSYFLRVDTEQRVTRTIQEWRDSLAQWPTTTRRRRENIFRVAAALTDSGLEFLFGTTLISVRACLVAASLSCALVTTTFAILLSGDGKFSIVLSAMSICFVLAAFAPAMLRTRKRAGLIVAASIIIGVGVVLLLAPKTLVGGLLFIMLYGVALFTAVACDVIFITMWRVFIRRALAQGSGFAILVFLLCAAVFAVLLAEAAYVGGSLAYKFFVSFLLQKVEGAGFGTLALAAQLEDIAVYLFALAAIPSMGTFAVYLVLVGLIVLDVTLWFLLERPIYALARHDIFKNRLRLAGIGVALIGISSSTLGDVITGVLSFMKK